MLSVFALPYVYSNDLRESRERLTVPRHRRRGRMKTWRTVDGAFPSEISQDVTCKSPKRPFLRTKAFCTSIFLGVLMFYLLFYYYDIVEFLSLFLFVKCFEYDLDVLVFVKRPKRVWWSQWWVDVLLLLIYLFISFAFVASSLSTINGIKSLFKNIVVTLYNKVSFVNIRTNNEQYFKSQHLLKDN